MASINRTLDVISERSVTAILQVPEGGRLRGAVFVNVGSGLSFVGWLDHSLDYKPGFGWGIAVRKSW